MSFVLKRPGSRVRLYSEEELKEMICFLYKYVNEELDQPRPLTERDFTDARKNKLRYNGKVLPHPSTFRQRIGGGRGLPGACKKADIPFDLVYHRATEH